MQQILIFRPIFVFLVTPRKRTASFGEEITDGKRPKLEQKGSDEVIQNCTQVLKRPSQSDEIVSKRNRLNAPDDKISILKTDKDECLNVMEVLQVEHQKTTNEMKKQGVDDLKSNMMDNDKKNLCEEEFTNVLSANEEKVDISNIKKSEEKGLKNNMLETDEIIIGKEETPIKNKEGLNSVVSNEEEIVDNSSTNVSEKEHNKSISASNKIMHNIQNKDQTNEDKEFNESDSDTKECLTKTKCDSSEITSDKLQPILNCDTDLNVTDKDSSSIKSNQSNNNLDALDIKDKNANDENKENVEIAGCSKDISNSETSIKSDALPKMAIIESKESPINKKDDNFQHLKTHMESKLKDIIAIDDDPQTPDLSNKSTEDSKESTSKVKTKHNGQYNKEEKMKCSKSPFELLNKNMTQQNEKKEMSNLDKAIESVVIKARQHEASIHLPILKKFHKDQLRSLTTTVSICHWF